MMTKAKRKQPISEYPFDETVIGFDKGEVSLDDLMAEYQERVAAAVAEARKPFLSALVPLAAAVRYTDFSYLPSPEEWGIWARLITQAAALAAAKGEQG